MIERSKSSLTSAIGGLASRRLRRGVDSRLGRSRRRFAGEDVELDRAEARGTVLATRLTSSGVTAKTFSTSVRYAHGIAEHRPCTG